MTAPTAALGTSALPPLRISAPGWLISLVMHLLLLIVLGICCFTSDVQRPRQLLAAVIDAPELEIIETPILPEIRPIDPVVTPDMPAAAALANVSIEVPIDVEIKEVEPLPSAEPLPIVEGLTNRPRDKQPGASGFSSRDPARRTKGLPSGATDTSEKAVAAGLRWLALHQRSDGSWNFDHRYGPCKTNPGGLVDAQLGATGLALLPFLGAGQTHKEGQYKANVKAGLAYLVRNMKLKDGKNGDLTDSGNMYSHGIATMALCEAYGMSKDRELIGPAQAAINYVVYAQDPVGGGWRYAARQPGDTSVVGWQLMALKSAHLAYLSVPPETIKGTSVFLDSVQADSGSSYGYTSPGDAQGTTSIGLLCRMHLGWKKDHGALERGVERLSKIGPSKNNFYYNYYYNYYATQVMLQQGGDRWKKWNDGLREQLVATQSKTGTEAGSWYIAGDHGSDRGGRIYCTAMATMILEVYYRIQPIYKAEAVEEDFPL